MEAEDLKTHSFDVRLKDSMPDADVLKLARLDLASPVSGKYQLQTASYLNRVCHVCQSVSLSANLLVSYPRCVLFPTQTLSVWLFAFVLERWRHNLFIRQPSYPPCSLNIAPLIERQQRTTLIHLPTVLFGRSSAKHSLFTF